MWKAVLAGTTALAIAGSSLVYAQQRGRPEGMARWRPNIEDMRAFGNARLAALHAGLELNADQEKNWPAFEQAARAVIKLHVDRMGAAPEASRDRQPQSGDPAERLRARANAMVETGTALQKLADATDPLYKSLDDGQKRRFAMLRRMMGPGARGPQGRGPNGPGGMMQNPHHMEFMGPGPRPRGGEDRL
jgi:hypothetical protein